MSHGPVAPYGPPPQWRPQPAYGPHPAYGWGPPPPPRKPVPLVGAILVAIGGLLAFLGCLLPWIGDYTGTVTGFELARTIETFGGDSGFTRLAVWCATIGGLVLIVLACIGIVRRSSPAWATIPASIIAALLALGNIYDFVSYASNGLFDFAQIGLWFYLLSGPIALVGAVGWSSEKF